MLYKKHSKLSEFFNVVCDGAKYKEIKVENTEVAAHYLVDEGSAIEASSLPILLLKSTFQFNF